MHCFLVSTQVYAEFPLLSSMYQHMLKFKHALLLCGKGVPEVKRMLKYRLSTGYARVQHHRDLAVAGILLCLIRAAMETAKDQSVHKYIQVHSMKHLGCGKGPNIVKNYLFEGNFTK